MKRLIKNCINYFKYSRYKEIKIDKNVSLKGSYLEGKNKIGDNTIFIRSHLGRGTYLGKGCTFSDTVVGRYCSIGNRLKIVSSTHPSSTFVSSHPAFFSKLKQAGFTYTNEQKFDEYKYLDKQEMKVVEIGNDVWIGDDVMILGGVKIYDGAIIGSKALVTKDVAPFSIVGGVPAKPIGKRFTDDEIKFLLDFKWWEKDENWISSNAYLFSDIEKFIKLN